MPGGTAFARPTIRTFPGPVSEAPPGIFLLVEQRVQLTTILRRQRVSGAQRGQNFLEHLTRLTVCGGQIFLQVAILFEVVLPLFSQWEMDGKQQHLCRVIY
mgnify:CR=1 FL=1